MKRASAANTSKKLHIDTRREPYTSQNSKHDITTPHSVNMTDPTSKMFAELHREMELTAPSKNESGQNVKRHPRHLLPQLTKKRKSLERDDRSEMAVEVEDDGKRIRGSRGAFEDVDSMPIMGRSKSEMEQQEEEEEADVADELDAGLDELGIDIGDDDEEYDEDNDDSADDEEDEADQDVPTIPSMDAQDDGVKSKTTKRQIVKKKKRTIYRLRDFSSHRLALRHGEALGAHIRGDSETAVQKLREVAKSAPGAPQVYSSLGMVYESMLDELEKKIDDDTATELLYQRKTELARKTYASLHIAAVLCKRDFTLWERSGDTAMRLVRFYSDMMGNSENHCGDDATELLKEWEKERGQWIEHALSAYSSADNLRPPGVDVPCKLARVHIELGNFIDALTIVTGLRARGSLEGSYPCWLLYADLMMKIGFECKRWNEGTSAGQSYMAKRWLRKYSVTFDWKERRLQALCLALEAAAGSKSCAELSKRMKKRSKQLFVDDIGKDLEQESNAEGNQGCVSAEGNNDQQQDTASSPKVTYEEERSNLVKRNEIELQKFDWKSNSMNLIEGSHVHRDRMAARSALVEKHRESVRDLAKRSLSNGLNTPSVSAEAVQESSDGTDALHLPLQASCATVCQIAALLLTQCAQTKLYEDGLVAARSVLLYYKERVERHKRRVDKEERRRIRSQGHTQPGFEYDGLNYDSDESDTDDQDLFISDDEDLQQPEYLDELQKGALPVNIRALYSLCLVGSGGQHYLAMSYLEKVMKSNELDLVANENTEGSNNAWTMFQNQFDLPLNKTSLLALVVDITKNKTTTQRQRLREMLKLHLDSLDKKHGLDQILSGTDELLKINTMKILFASLEMLVETAEIDLESLIEMDNTSDSDGLHTVVNDAHLALSTVIRFQHILWRPDRSDGSLPERSFQALGIVSGAMSILAHVVSTIEGRRFKDLIRSTLLKCQSIISLICDGVMNETSITDYSVSDSWTTFPLSSDWQSSFQKSLSTLAFNLSVGCCVSSFSGWCSDEFNLDLLTSRNDSNVFGLNMEGNWVAGFLSDDAAASVSRQWDRINELLPNLESLRFDTQLNQRKDKEWCRKIMPVVKRQTSKIASFREDDGLVVLLSFSSICLVTAQLSEGKEKDDLIQLAMSVLLPITQFSIDKDVWKTKIGARAISEVNETSIGYYVDENSQWLGPTKNVRKTNLCQNNTKQSRDQYSRRTSSKPRSNIRRVRRSSFFGIQLPTSTLLSEWNQDEAHRPITEASQDATFAMTAVDDAMKNLKKSRTINSLERSSLDVAVALVNVASYEECHNPFLCLQQAAIFSAMAPKLGNSDEPFKAFLPLQKKCTSLNALVILGRADCLRAIHFLESAQFLVSWVAKVCSLCRSHLEEELPWTSRWKVIGAYLSFVAANIDGTAAEFDMTLPSWEEAVKQEISYGKSDAKTLMHSRRKDSIDGVSLHEDQNDDAMPMLGNISTPHNLGTPHSFQSHVMSDTQEYDLFGDRLDDDMEEAQDDLGDNNILFQDMNWAPV